MKKRAYVVCPCCFRSELTDRMMARGESESPPGSFWNLVVVGGKGRPTVEERKAAQAAGLNHAPGRGFINKVQLDVQEDEAVVKELMKRCRAFLLMHGEKP